METKSKLLKESVQLNEELKQKIEKLKASEDQLKVYREKYDKLLKDKAEAENFALNQEKIIKSLEEENKAALGNSKEKDTKFKQLDNTCASMIKVVDEYKKNNKQLQAKLNRKIADEKKLNALLLEKDNEIQLLKSFVNTLKKEKKKAAESKGQNLYENETNIKMKMNKIKADYANKNYALPMINDNYSYLGRPNLNPNTSQPNIYANDLSGFGANKKNENKNETRKEIIL